MTEPERKAEYRRTVEEVVAELGCDLRRGLSSEEMLEPLRVPAVSR